MTSLIRIAIEGDEIGLPIRGQRFVTKAAFKEIGQEWSRNMLPDHFNRNKQAKYAYRSRTKAYMRRKRREALRGNVKGGGVTDLVFSGRTRDSVMGFNRVQAFPTRATVHLNTPNYARTNYKPGRPNIGAEITKVLPSESRQLDQVGSRKLEQATAQWQKNHPVRRRIT